MDREGGVIDRRQAIRQAWSSGVVTVFVPPTIFQEVEAVLDPPMLTDVPQQIGGGDMIRIEATNVVAGIVQHDVAIVRAQLTIHAEGNATTRQVERFADIVGVVEIDPDAASFFQSPFLSVVSAAGARCGACAKQCSRASSASP